MSIARFKRYFGYSFWVALEVAVFTGLSRLVVFPVVAYLIGKEEFGLFIFSLGIVMLIAKAPSAGLETGVIRHMAELPKPEQEVLISTGVRLCKIAMLATVSVGVVALFVARYFWQTDPKIIWSIVPLLILLYSWNLFELQVTRYRVERRFALRTAWYSYRDSSCCARRGGWYGVGIYVWLPGRIYCTVLEAKNSFQKISL